ncbi:hypothetical protein D9757_008392 [Collybiopsis confluens]|uniref:DUF6534 domain-containing protein n=1 Tax=Collybiopsis confluens TaxID=2823264 RepID=A0A8H5HH72_9AGAR|nr:hypothetical protein D9757_008392 [Collybiopsis confluens]
MSFVVHTDIPRTYGALLMGALFASFLSGAVTVQTLVYYKLYPSDNVHLKSLVLTIWLLDTCHTGLIWGSQWEYLIGFFGDKTKIDFVPTTLALSIAFTVSIRRPCTVPNSPAPVNLQHNTTLLTPEVFVGGSHVPCAFFFCSSDSSAEQTQLVPRNSFGGYCFPETCLIDSNNGDDASLWLILWVSGTFQGNNSNDQLVREVCLRTAQWLFTLGLALSSAVDVIITISLFVLLMKSKTVGGSLDGVIDALILYTFETGSITCAATIISMILWIVVPTELFFMALHFIIGKFYATSLLVTLNSRKSLREVRTSNRGSSSGGGRAPPLAAYVLEHRRPDFRASKHGYDAAASTVTELQINVARSVEYTTDHYGDINHGYSTGPPSF